MKVAFFVLLISLLVPVSYGLGQFFDDFEYSSSGLYSSYWSSKVGASVSSSCGPPRSGKNYLRLGGTSSSSYVRTQSMSLTTTTYYVKFYVKNGGTCDKAESGEELRVEVSINGGSTYSTCKTVSYTTSSTTWQYAYCSFTGSSTTVVRLKQASSSYNLDYWLVDDFEISTGSSQNRVIGVDEGKTSTISSALWASAYGVYIFSSGCTSPYVGSYFFKFSSSSSGRYILSSTFNWSLYVPTLYFHYHAKNGGTCDDADTTSENLLLQYSVDSGSTWTTMGTTTYTASETSWTAYRVTVPSAAKVAGVKFRFYQSANSGYNFDCWLVDGIQIGGNYVYTSSASAVPTPYLTGYGSSQKVMIWADTFDNSGTPNQAVYASDGVTQSSDCSSYSGSYALVFGDVQRAPRYWGNAAGISVSSSYKSWAKSVYIEFYERAGSGGSCESPDSGEELMLSYSTSSGTFKSWTKLTEYGDSPTYFKYNQVYLPSSALTSPFYFNFSQKKSSGSTVDFYALDNVKVFVSASPPPADAGTIVGYVAAGIAGITFLSVLCIIQRRKAAKKKALKRTELSSPVAIGQPYTTPQPVASQRAPQPVVSARPASNYPAPVASMAPTPAQPQGPIAAAAPTAPAAMSTQPIQPMSTQPIQPYSATSSGGSQQYSAATAYAPPPTTTYQAPPTTTYQAPPTTTYQAPPTTYQQPSYDSYQPTYQPATQPAAAQPAYSAPPAYTEQTPSTTGYMYQPSGPSKQL